MGGGSGPHKPVYEPTTDSQFGEDCATTIVMSGRRQLGWPVSGDGLSPRRQADDNWRRRLRAWGGSGGESRAAAVALGIEFEDGGVVDQPVDRGHGHRRVGEDLVPLAEGLVAGGNQAAALVALGDELEQDVGLGLVLAHVAEVVEDEHI